MQLALQRVQHKTREVIAAAALCALSASAASAPVRDADQLLGLINAYRAAPEACNGRTAGPMPALKSNPALVKVRIGPGVFLEQVLKNAGYPPEHVEAVHVSGLQDAGAVMNAIKQAHCQTLLNPRFVDIGIVHEGDGWQIVLARPAPPLRALLPDGREAGMRILAAVNAARAASRTCGDRDFPPAPALTWNPMLGEAALAHSRTMAALRRFSHVEPDGGTVANRATRAGYRWRVIGENIALGQKSVDEAVADWLDSPGHCANILNGRFTETGAAYAISDDGARVYWTQVFGTPR